MLYDVNAPLTTSAGKKNEIQQILVVLLLLGNHINNNLQLAKKNLSTLNRNVTYLVKRRRNCPLRLEMRLI